MCFRKTKLKFWRGTPWGGTSWLFAEEGRGVWKGWVLGGEEGKMRLVKAPCFRSENLPPRAQNSIFPSPSIGFFSGKGGIERWIFNFRSVGFVERVVDLEGGGKRCLRCGKFAVDGDDDVSC